MRNIDVVLCQVINDLYIGQGNPVPTNGSTHHLSIDKTVGYLSKSIYCD